MNLLLDKKYEEKMNLYINNIIQDIKDYNKKTDNNKTNDNDFIFHKNINNYEKNHFDKIYSYFYLFPKQIGEISNSNLLNSLNNNEESKNIESENIDNFQIKSMKGQKINKTRNDNSKRIYNENNGNTIHRSNIKSINVGVRLYNDSFLKKEKMEKIRKMQDDEFKKNLKPQITQRAKKIKGDKNRLYNENIIKKMRKNNSQNNIYENKICSFKPKLNKNSLKIAEKLEPSSSRLNKKKLKLNEDDIIDLTKKSYADLFGNKLIKKYIQKSNDSYYNKTTSRSTENINKRINDFYQKQIEKIKFKEQKYIENKLKKENEYLKYSFHPIINNKRKINSKLNKNGNNKTNSNSNTNTNTFERLYKNTNKTCRKQTNTTIVNETYTFRPEISPLKIKDDKKIILDNLERNSSYIQKRRKNLEIERNLEDYKSKRMGSIYGFFKPAITIRDKRLTERSSKGRNTKNKNNDNEQNQNNVKYIITKGTTDFNDNNTNSKEKIFYYLNNENNDMNINIIKYSNIKYDLNHQEFVNAINALHNQIDNLDI